MIAPTLASFDIDSGDHRVLVNPTGRFEVGGPMGDAGLTGRKIIIDTYGGMARHGGGAFSGKDPSKVDRSAAYAMRWVAKNVVAAGLARRCEVQVAYAIGKAHPVGLFVETFGTGTVPDAVIQAAVLEVFDLRPAAIIRDLDLLSSDLRADGGVRTLRSRPAGLHLGAHRPVRRAHRRRQRLTRALLIDWARRPCPSTVPGSGRRVCNWRASCPCPMTRQPPQDGDCQPRSVSSA